jgi:hypothetical protein
MRCWAVLAGRRVPTTFTGLPMFSDEIERIEAGLQEIIDAFQGIALPTGSPSGSRAGGRYSCQMRQLVSKLHKILLRFVQFWRGLYSLAFPILVSGAFTMR